MLKKRILQLIILAGVAGIIFYLYTALKKIKEERKWKEYVASLVHTASPQVDILVDTVTIDYLNKKRTLSVYLPAAYHTDSLDYPVMYFLDGQSLFDEKILEGDEWQIDEVLDSLAEFGGPQAIVVGIYNAEDRLTEYKPYKSEYYPKEVITGVEHAAWIATDLKQWVDSNYRTKRDPANTFIGGASLGGLMSYDMVTTFSDVYGGAFVYSPSFWVNDKVYSLDDQVSDWSDKKIYLNAGELETPTVESVIKMYDILKGRGMTHKNLKMDIEAEEGHWHMTWRKGSHKAVPWMLNYKS